MLYTKQEVADFLNTLKGLHSRIGVIGNNDPIVDQTYSFLNKKKLDMSLYEKVVIVDPKGPIKSIVAGSAAVDAFQKDNPNKKALVVVTKGVYDEFDILFPGCAMFCEKGAIVMSTNASGAIGNQVITDRNRGAGDYNLFGHGRFYRRFGTVSGSLLTANMDAIAMTASGSTFYLEADEAHTVRFVNNSGGLVRGTVKIKRVSGLTVSQQGTHLLYDGVSFLNGAQVAGFLEADSFRHFKNCTFIKNAAEYGTSPVNEKEIFDDDGNSIGFIAFTTDNFVVTPADLSGLTEQQAIDLDPTNDEISAALHITQKASFTLSQTSVVLEDCKFQVSDTRGVGIKIWQEVDPTVPLRVRIINPKFEIVGSPTETTAMAFLSATGTVHPNETDVSIEGHIISNLANKFGTSSTHRVIPHSGQDGGVAHKQMARFGEFANDAAAATGGVVVGETYFNTTSDVFTKRQV